MIIEFDGIFIEANPAASAQVLGCRIFTEHQPCIALFNCDPMQFCKLQAMSYAMQDEDKRFYAARFFVDDLITYLDDSMGIVVLTHEAN